MKREGKRRPLHATSSCSYIYMATPLTSKAGLEPQTLSKGPAAMTYSAPDPIVGMKAHLVSSPSAPDPAPSALKKRKEKTSGGGGTKVKKPKVEKKMNNVAPTVIDGVSVDTIIKSLKRMIEGKDLGELSQKKLRKELEKKYNINLSDEYKKYFKSLVVDIVTGKEVLAPAPTISAIDVEQSKALVSAIFHPNKKSEAPKRRKSTAGCSRCGGTDHQRPTNRKCPMYSTPVAVLPTPSATSLAPPADVGATGIPVKAEEEPKEEKSDFYSPPIPVEPTGPVASPEELAALGTSEHFATLFGVPGVTALVSCVFHDGPLGLVFQPALMREDVYIVEDIVPDSQVEHKHMIRVGDVIAAVNDTLVQGLKFEEVYELLKTTPRPMVIRFTRGAYPPEPKPPRPTTDRVVPGLSEEFSRRLLSARYSSGNSTEEARPIDSRTIDRRNTAFLSCHAGPFAQLSSFRSTEALQKQLVKSGRALSTLKQKARKDASAVKQLQAQIRAMGETQFSLKEKANECVLKARVATSNAKEVARLNSKLRSEVNKKTSEQASHEKTVEKLTAKNAELRKMAQDAVIQRSLLTSEATRLASELTSCRKELRESTHRQMNNLNSETSSAAVNPEKNEETKTQLKLVRMQLEQRELADGKRRAEEAMLAQVLPKRFKKLVLKQIISQLTVPLSCVCGASGRGDIAVTVENVNDFVFRTLFGQIGRALGEPKEGRPIRKLLTENDLATLFDKSFRREVSILLPRPRRFLLELITKEDGTCMVLSYAPETLTLKLNSAYTVIEATGMGLKSLGKSIRLG